MVDTIKISWHGFLNISNENLKKYNEACDVRTGEVIGFSGFHRNLRINYFKSKLTIQGSLSRYLTGYNVNIASYEEIVKGILELSKEFGINLNDGIISRLDLANNFEVDVNPTTLYKSFLNSINYNRFQEKSTLYYNSGPRKKAFYSKAGVKDVHLLRFETRYAYPALKRWAEKHLRKNVILVSDLITRETYNRICKIWYHEFKSITIAKTLLLNFEKIKGVKDFETHLALEGVKSFGGMQETFELLNNSLSNNILITSKMKTRLKNYLKTLGEREQFTVENSTMKNISLSLNRKMWENYAF